MRQLTIFIVAFLRDQFRSRASMQAEILALRHQLGIYQRMARRLRIRPADRLFWSWLSRVWSRWRDCLVIVQPETGDREGSARSDSQDVLGQSALGSASHRRGTG